MGTALALVAEVRRCKTCSLEKPLDDAHFRARSKGGRGYFGLQCRDCTNAATREKRKDPAGKERRKSVRQRYLANPSNVEKRNETRRRYYEENGSVYRERAARRGELYWAERLLNSAKHASKQRQGRGRNCPVTIAHEQLESQWRVQAGLCYFTGIPLVTNRGRLDTVSIDRLDPGLGYEPGNVVLSTKAANFARSGHSADEFLVFLMRMAKALPQAPCAKGVL